MIFYLGGPAPRVAVALSALLRLAFVTAASRPSSFRWSLLPATVRSQPPARRARYHRYRFYPSSHLSPQVNHFIDVPRLSEYQPNITSTTVLQVSA